MDPNTEELNTIFDPTNQQFFSPRYNMTRPLPAPAFKASVASGTIIYDNEGSWRRRGTTRYVTYSASERTLTSR